MSAALSSKLLAGASLPPGHGFGSGRSRTGGSSGSNNGSLWASAASARWCMRKTGCTVRCSSARPHTEGFVEVTVDREMGTVCWPDALEDVADRRQVRHQTVIQRIPVCPG